MIRKHPIFFVALVLALLFMARKQIQAIYEVGASLGEFQRAAMACEAEIKTTKWRERVGEGVQACTAPLGAGPWYFDFEAMYHGGRLHITELRFPSVFADAPEQVKGCMEKVLAGIPNPDGVHHEFGERHFSEKARFALRAYSKEAKPEIATKPSCIISPQAPILAWAEHKNSFELRDSFRIVGQPVEQDQVQLRIKACEAKVASQGKQDRFLLRMDKTRGKNGTSYRLGSGETVAQEWQPYADCVLSVLGDPKDKPVALTPGKNQVILKSGEAVEIPATQVEAADQKSEEIFVRLPPTPMQPRYYLLPIEE